MNSSNFNQDMKRYVFLHPRNTPWQKLTISNQDTRSYPLTSFLHYFQRLFWVGLPFYIILYIYSNLVGIICPPGWNRVNLSVKRSAKNWGHPWQTRFWYSCSHACVATLTIIWYSFSTTLTHKLVACASDYVFCKSVCLAEHHKLWG